jgi:hypothetical protein
MFWWERVANVWRWVAKLGKWVAKLEAHLLATAAPKNKKTGDISKGEANTLARQKNM